MSADDVLRKHLEKVLMARAELIEMHCAAFVEETGSAEASKYRLVERYAEDGKSVSWAFERRSGDDGR